jgi:uncharacterized protein YbjT (DUF2867 family)
VRGDLLDPGSLDPLVPGVRVVYFLAHGLRFQPRGSGDLARDERESVHALVALAKREGVERIIFVSGLGAAADAPSEHLRARFAVEEELRGSGLGFTVFRAGLLLGPGSAGFEALLAMLARRVVVPVPPWSRRPMQPYALGDLLLALERAAREDAFLGKTVELGTSDGATYAGIAREAARAAGLRRVFLPVPLGLRSLTVRSLVRLGKMDERMAQALLQTMLECPAVVGDDGRSMRELGLPVRTLPEALEIALADVREERRLAG